MKKIICFFMTIITYLSLTGCSSQISYDAISGKYELSTLEIDGEAHEYGDDMWNYYFGEGSSQLSLYDDMSFYFNYMGSEVYGTYVAENMTVTLTGNDGTNMVLTVKDNHLRCIVDEKNNIVIVYDKAFY